MSRQVRARGWREKLAAERLRAFLRRLVKADDRRNADAPAPAVSSPEDASGKSLGSDELGGGIEAMRGVIEAGVEDDDEDSEYRGVSAFSISESLRPSGQT